MPAGMPHTIAHARTHRARFAASALLAACVGLMTSSHAGAESPPRYRVTYRAPDGCPDERAFMALIAKRAPRAEHSDEAERAHHFTVEIVLDDERKARGNLSIEEPDGNTTRRDVPAKDCVNAVEAIALIAAVILDPRAAESSAADASQVSASPRPSPAPSPPSRPGRAPASSPVDGTARPARSFWRPGLAVSGTLQGAIAPELTPGISASGVLLWDRPGLWQPFFSLAGHYAQSGTTTTTSGEADFQWYAARATLCPVRWPDGGRVTLRACAFGDLGVLRGEGRLAENARDAPAFWAAAGPSARLEVAISPAFGLALEAGLLLPAFHDRFVFVPGEVAHEVPERAIVLAIGAQFGGR
jgi:hypothetical protein